MRGRSAPIDSKVAPRPGRRKQQESMSQNESPSQPTPNTLIADLRNLRGSAQTLYRDLKDDIAAFQQPDGTFSTYPPPKGDKIHVTTTCTALMALSAGREIDSLCPPNK